MRKIIVLFTSILIFSAAGNAQLWKMRRVEVGGGPGITQFYGDIGGFSRGENMIGFKDFSFRHTRINLNMNIRYRVLNNVSARVNFNFGSFHSTDVRGSNEGRDFESGTVFFEPSVLAEYYYLKNKGENSFLSLKGRGTPFMSFFSTLDCYVFTGVGSLSYKVKPNAALASKLQETKGITPVVPFGLGANIMYTPHINLGVELGGRFTSSDNIEGYTSEYSQKNDTYFFFNFMFVYKMKTSIKGMPAF